MNAKVRVQLSIMMFIQFFIWGAWFVSLGTYLGELKFTGVETGNAYSTTNWAAVLAPFIVGMIADKFFPAQVVLGVLHLLGALLMWYASGIVAPGQLFLVLLAYSLCYMPTLALVNAISFNQMKDPQTEFPSVRVLGTVGWIAAGWILSLLVWEKTANPMKMAAIASVVLGIYSFFLPNTPPKSAGKKVTVAQVLGLDALKLLRDPNFSIFVLSSLFICIPLAFYYTWANNFLSGKNLPYPTLQQSFGQISEVGFMILMPLFFKRLGVKKMLLIGMAAWAVRYVLFAFGAPAFPMVLMYWVAILLHGVCYDFFFVTGQIYVDRKAPKEIQASAQGLIALVTYGAGMVIGNFIAGKVFDIYTSGQEHNWTNIWLVPAAMAAMVLVAFALMFREPKDADAK